MKLYSCPMCCNLGFKTQKDLKEHLSKAIRIVNCPICNKVCKNIIYLVKHLDQCTKNDQERHNTTINNSSVHFKNSLLEDSKLSELTTTDQVTSDTEDDDVEGYFCTVCDTKIPDVFAHIQQFHSGQDVILQDDDDDDDDSENSKDPSNTHLNSSTEYDESNFTVSFDNSTNKLDNKRKLDESMNGEENKELPEKRIRKKVNRDKDDEDNEIYFCSYCNVSLTSLADHMKKFHKDYDVILQDLSITELFPESRVINDTFTYICSCCQKSFVRKSTLVRHLKLNTLKEKFKRKCYQKKNDVKEENSMVGFENNCNVEKDVTNSFDTEYEIEEVKPENYELDDLGHSIFNT